MKLLKLAGAFFILAVYVFTAYNDYFSHLEKELVKQSPAVIMQRYKTISARAKRSGDFMLPDLGTEAMLMSGGYQITVSQMIPFPTKMYSKSQQLNKNYKAAQAEFLLLLSQIRSEFKFYYISLYFLVNKLKILNDNYLIIEQLESQVSSQVISGKIPTSKLLFIQIEKEKLLDTINRAETKIKNLVQTISVIFDNKLDEKKNF